MVVPGVSPNPPSLPKAPHSPHKRAAGLSGQGAELGPGCLLSTQASVNGDVGQCRKIRERFSAVPGQSFILFHVEEQLCPKGETLSLLSDKRCRGIGECGQDKESISPAALHTRPRLIPSW